MNEQEVHEKEQAWQEQLSWFVTGAPLYNVVKIPRRWYDGDAADTIMPKIVSMPCEICEQTTNWGGEGSSYHAVGYLGSIQYRCRNCRTCTVTIYYQWQYVGMETHFEKVGRYPKFEISPPSELGKALGKRVDLYRRGMTCRHHGFGLGALVYFRRIVEDTTGELLDLLEATVQEAGGDETALKIIKDARSRKAFDDKVKVAASALPNHIRLGGVNPLDLLYDLLSDGIHVRTDKEAIEIVDGMERVLEYLFAELKAHTQKRKIFTEAIKQLLLRREKVKKESS